MLKILSIAVLLLATGATVKADDFSDQAMKMLEVGNTIKPTLDMMDRMLVTMSPNLVQQIELGFSTQGKSVDHQDVVDLVNEYRKEVVVRFSGELAPIMVEELRKQFTLEEVMAITEVMETPAFKLYTDRVPAIMASAQSVGEQVGTKIGKEVMQELIQNNPKFH